MKKLALILAALAAVSAFADEWVNPYVRKDGTYVQGHHRTAPDSNPYNNYSTQGNTNPYTGQQGTVNPYQQPVTPTYQTPTYQYRAPVCGVAANGQYVCR